MSVDESEFQSDLERLSPSALRSKYSKEASAHAAMKTRVRKAAEAGSYSSTLNPAWDEFRAFLEHMGPLPFDSASLDRIDYTDPEYGPGKVRWADKRTQTRNRSNTRMILWRGEEMPLAEYAERIGVSVGAARAALIDRKEDPEDYARKRVGGPVDASSISFIQGTKHITASGVLAAYEKWKAESVRRRTRKKEALPEIFFLFRAKIWIDQYRARLEASGFNECDSDEEREAHPEWTNYERLRELLDCSQRAKASLIEKEPSWQRHRAFHVGIASRMKQLEEAPIA